MNNVTEQFAVINKAFTEAAVRFAKTSFDNTERLVALNVEAARHSLEESTKSVKALSDVKDPQDLLALRTKLAESAADKATGYSRHLYDLASNAQEEFTKLAEDNWALISKNLNSTVDQLTKSAPAGTDGAFAALKSGIAASNAAMENVGKVSKQFSSIASANIKAATQQAVAASTKGSRKAA
jgi:phasin family protein